ncbi:FAD-dependent oxidoreductase [Rossellomorea vietnamensis]|uniref:FAD-dependent oxidoreductase n=1 Tax=Rossellomorea vietnamensis TaxID=218284 RepID=UPI001E370F69|nr:FAD-dependent oxidoreductase [Rossellomorea vietnamensis]MCC5801670.1 SidA/IucD/PvdA family monooxygenase [Rossellomorea vietnamensis]
MFEWIIIGGGIHGCTVATYLVKKKKVPIEKICVIDPYPEPLHKWKRVTGFIAMPFLRSPFVHHLDINPFSLQSFKKDDGEHFFGPYKRPALSLFNQHSFAVLEEIEMHKAWYQGMVNQVEKGVEGWVVKTSTSNHFHGKNLVIATGMNHQLSYPSWGEELASVRPKQAGHLFEESLPHMEPPFVVIGGGISAAHLVIKLSNEFPGQVYQVARHPYRVHDFDSDPGWLGPKHMSSFERISHYDERRDVITEARHKGSMPRELANKLRNLIRHDACTFTEDEIESWDVAGDDIILQLTKQKSGIKAKTILFATGFSKEIMKVDWLQNLIQQENLTCAKCGFPIVNEDLSWCNHLFVTGPLAELEIGPVSRNISGARKAAERIVNHAI